MRHSILFYFIFSKFLLARTVSVYIEERGEGGKEDMLKINVASTMMDHD